MQSGLMFIKACDVFSLLQSSSLSMCPETDRRRRPSLTTSPSPRFPFSLGVTQIYYYFSSLSIALTVLGISFPILVSEGLSLALWPQSLRAIDLAARIGK